MNKTETSLEFAALKAKLEEAENTLKAIRQGAVDALVVPGPEGEKVYTLQGSDYGYRVMIENMAEGAVTISRTGQILYCNRSFAKLVEKPLEDVLGSVISDYVQSQDLPAWTYILQHVHQDEIVGRQLTLKSKSDKDLPTRISASTLPNRDSPHICLVVSDLTEQVQHEQAFRRQEEELHQVRKIEAIGRLAGGVAHDFNNLIAGIMGISEELKSGLPAEDPRQTDIDEILKASQRAFEMTKQLLAFGRRQVVQSRVLNIDAAIEEASCLLRRLIRADVQLHLETSNPGWIRIDAGLFEQVLINLILNARDALPEGGNITIRTRQETLQADSAVRGLSAGPYIVLDVADNGIGMAPETLSHIFEPFFTTKTKEQGTGLGLSTVHGIIKQSGGEIRVDSQLGQGTRFRLSFPQVEPGNTAAVPAHLHSESRPASETLLVVEDEDIVRRVVVRILHRAGYTVLEAADGPQALAACRAHPGIHLIISDVILPGMNGREIIAAAKAEQPQVEVLFISGYPSDVISEKHLLQEGISFLEKTELQAGLLPRVRELLARRA